MPTTQNPPAGSTPNPTRSRQSPKPCPERPRTTESPNESGGCPGRTGPRYSQAGPAKHRPSPHERCGALALVVIAGLAVVLRRVLDPSHHDRGRASIRDFPASEHQKDDQNDQDDLSSPRLPCGGFLGEVRRKQPFPPIGGIRNWQVVNQTDSPMLAAIIARSPGSGWAWRQGRAVHLRDIPHRTRPAQRRSRRSRVVEPRKRPASSAPHAAGSLGPHPQSHIPSSWPAHQILEPSPLARSSARNSRPTP